MHTVHRTAPHRKISQKSSIWKTNEEASTSLCNQLSFESFVARHFWQLFNCTALRHSPWNSFSSGLSVYSRNEKQNYISCDKTISTRLVYSVSFGAVSISREKEREGEGETERKKNNEFKSTALTWNVCDCHVIFEIHMVLSWLWNVPTTFWAVSKKDWFHSDASCTYFRNQNQIENIFHCNFLAINSLRREQQ